MLRCSQKELRLLSAKKQQDTDMSPKPRGMLGLASSVATSKKQGTDFMQQLAEVGLLDVVWLAERVLLGMCVNRQLKLELMGCPTVVIPVRPGRDIPADRILQKLTGTFSVCADVLAPAPAPSQKTRSIKSFMKSLLEADDDAETPPTTASVRNSQGPLPLLRLRNIRHRIRTLDLENCNVGADGGIGVSSLLYTHQYRNKRCNARDDMGELQELSLPRNHIATTPALFAAISSLPNLRLLNLSHNKMGAAGSKALSDVLVKCQSLLSLDISDNDIKDDGLAHICQALPQLALLCRLAATSNSIGDAGATSLAQVLPRSSSLVEVDLCSNMVSEEGQWTLLAARVACRLASSSRLVKIDMRRFRHFHPLGGNADPDWCFLCYSSDKCTCPVK